MLRRQYPNHATRGITGVSQKIPEATNQLIKRLFRYISTKYENIEVCLLIDKRQKLANCQVMIKSEIIGKTY